MARNTQAGGLEVCPASQFAALEGGEAHYAPREELTRNGGVCKDCRRQFDKKHRRAIKRKPLSAVEMSREQWDPAVRGDATHATVRYEEDGSENGARAGTWFAPAGLEQFEFAAIAEPEERSSAVGYAAAVLRKFALRLVEKSATPQKLWVNLHALCYAARVHPRQDRTASSLARELRMSKANFSVDLNYWRDLLGLPGGRRIKPGPNGRRPQFLDTGREARGRADLGGVFVALGRVEREMHRCAEQARAGDREQREELRDRLRPLAKLYGRLEAELAGN